MLYNKEIRGDQHHSGNKMNRKQRRALHKKKIGPDRLISLGIAAHKQAEFDEAGRFYRSVLEMEPGHPDALHYLGVLLHRCGNSQAGLEMVQKSLAVDPENINALNNLGNIHKEIGELEEAARCYKMVLELRADHADALNNLGIIHKEIGDLEEAARCYQKVLELQADHIGALNNLGIILRIHRDYTGALDYFKKALNLNPNNADIHQNISNCYRNMQRFDEAIDCYWTAIHLRPYDENEYSYLRHMLYALGQGEKAFRLIEEWLEREPGNVEALHLRATFSPDSVPGRADNGYVRKTFDSFANSFDSVLKKLDYRAPELVSALINSRYSAASDKPAVLDAGCGTGLCGPLIKASVTRLDGVDLSPGMLEKASKRNVYDELFEAELTGFIGSLANAYDVILCADTLVYFGDLKPVFDAASSALRPGGILIFTVEKSHRSLAFELQQHGRYCHCENYLRSTLDASGFSINSCECVVLRRELGEDVEGFLMEAVISKESRRPASAKLPFPTLSSM